MACHVLCSTTEQKFLEASLAYQAGKPIVTDEQYDELKAKLRKKNSIVVQQVCLPDCCAMSHCTCTRIKQWSSGRRRHAELCKLSCPNTLLLPLHTRARAAASAAASSTATPRQTM